MGWSRLSDAEIAEWHAERPNMPQLQWILADTGELDKRGMVIQDCPECEEVRIRYHHDFICILCRKEQGQ